MRNLVNDIVARYFQVSEAELLINGAPVSAIAARYGTPLFVYDRSVLDQKLACLRNALPSEFAISYSVKANPNPAIVKYFVDQGCGLEIASRGELRLALHAGCPRRQIVFAGPGKTEAELELALSHGIGEIHVESMLEAERISAISRRLGIQARVAIRINPGGEAQGGAMQMGGKPAPFGVDEECLDIMLDRLLSDASFIFRGVHLYAATQILDYTILARQYRKGVEIARRVADRLGQPLHTIDFGGGFGIPYFANEQALDLDGLRQVLQTLMAEIQYDPLFAGSQFMVEPGRFLVGEAGVYIARVNDIKLSRGKMFLILDGGMHHHLAASGNLGQVIRRNFPVALVNKMRAEPEHTVDVVGPLCTPLDNLAREARLPIAEVGDLIGIFQSGAYARTASPLGFLSHPEPPEVWVEAGQTTLIRPRAHGAEDF